MHQANNYCSQVHVKNIYKKYFLYLLSASNYSNMLVGPSIQIWNNQEAPSSLYSCACVHVGSCTTRKPVILRCMIYTWHDHWLCNASSSTVCCDESVTLFRTGSVVTGNGLPPSWNIEGKIMCMHKFACTNVTPKKNKKKKEKRRQNLSSCRYHAWVIIQIKHSSKIPTGRRQTSWLFTKRGGVEFGTTENKSS